MSLVKTGNVAHDNTVAVSEATLQSAVKAATTQAAINSATVTHYRACLASAIKNGCGTQVFITALRALGYPGG